MTIAASSRNRAAKRLGALAAIATVSLGLSACSLTDTSDGAGGEDAKTVTILTHDAFDLPDELIEKFEKETGYKLVTTSPGDGATVVNQLILTKDAPAVDGVFGLNAYNIFDAIDADVLDTYTSKNLPESATPYDFDEHVTPIDLGAVCVNADNAWFSEHNMEIPQTLDELSAEENAKLLVIENPVESETGFAFLAGLASAKEEEGAISFLNSMLDGGMRVDSSWSDAYYTDFSGADGKGEYPLVLSYSTSPAETEGATSIIEATCVQETEYAAVVKGAANPEGARAFIDFLLSDEVQAAFPEAMYMYPINSKIELPQAWAQYARLPEAALPYEPRLVAEQSEHWRKAWTDLYESR